MLDRWEPVIGLEMHIQLATVSKIFSGAATAYGALPNRQACAIDLGMPGTLPVLNAEAVHMAVKFGLAVGGKIAGECVFARKNYFYPDLPKGYQISQYEQPIVSGGSLDITLPDGSEKTVYLTRAHLEEDAGKSLHEGASTGVDLNRAGTPLLEIVSEPELSSAQEAAIYMRKLHNLVRYLGICDGNLQEGSFRCDANVSVRPRGEARLGTRAELKNINSFRFVERAIDYEIHRQVHMLESGGHVVQETRLYDPDRNETRAMRSKEEAQDYRYFPDPDLLPVVVSDALIAQIQDAMPELPDAKYRRYLKELALTPEEAATLVGEPQLAAFFEQTLMAGDINAKLCANWVSMELLGALRKQNLSIEQSPIAPESLAGLLRRIDDGTISGKLAKQVFAAMLAGDGQADEIILAGGLRQITDDAAIEGIIDQVLAQFPAQILQYQAGDAKVFNFFVGQVMKITHGKANPVQLRELLQRKLNK